MIKKQNFTLRKIPLKQITAVVVITLVTILGVKILLPSHAITPYASIDASSGNLSGSATLQTDSSSHDGQSVQFGYQFPLTSSLAVYVKGAQLVNGEYKQIRLLGTDVSGPEYCSFTHNVGDGNPLDSAEAAEIASWKMNAVRIPLNEDCWLGINGISINGESAVVSAQTYQTSIENWVTALNNAGVIAILDLHWTAPGTNLSNQQWPMTDEDHSPTFWTQVATAFKSNPAVMFDLFNEPFIGNSNAAVSSSVWSCWLSGCNTTFTGKINGVANSSITYTTAGMQQLVSAVRTTGASQPIILGGLNYASDPCGLNNKFGSTASCTELANLPTDPENQLVVDYHNYSSGGSTAAYWDPHWTSEFDALQKAGVAMVTDEFGESDCSASFMNMYMSWADQNNESYLAWSWNPNSTTTPACVTGSDSNYLLLSDWNGDPSTLIPQGANYKAHLLSVSPY